MSTLFASGEGLTAAKLNALDDRLIAAENAVYPQAWNTATLSAGWTTPGGTSAVPAYRLDGYTVWLRGVLMVNTGGVTGPSTIFTLPVGYRPASGIVVKMVWPLIDSGGLATSTNVRFDVLDTGVFRLTTGSRVASEQFLLDGIAIPI